MKKLILTCACGQRIQLPRSAVGKTGVCPTCGRAIPITKENTKPLTAEARERARIVGNNPNAAAWKADEAGGEEARRLFGRAADLYCEGRYGEALSIFDSLSRRFPGLPEIENARRQCLEARKRGPMALPGPAGQAPLTPSADADTVKEFVLRKMFQAKSEEVQLHAAELMAKILGMIPAQGQPTTSEKAAVDPESNTEPEEASAAESHEEEVPDATRVNISDFAADPKRNRA